MTTYEDWRADFINGRYEEVFDRDDIQATSAENALRRLLKKHDSYVIEMSRGSPLVSIRIPAELLEQVDQKVTRSATRRDVPWTRSSFIVAAIEEKLKKMARSAKHQSPIPPTYRRDSSTF
jgi:hypothetical protein